MSTKRQPRRTKEAEIFQAVESVLIEQVNWGDGTGYSIVGYNDIGERCRAHFSHCREDAEGVGACWLNRQVSEVTYRLTIKMWKDDVGFRGGIIS